MFILKMTVVVSLLVLMAMMWSMIADVKDDDGVVHLKI